MGVIKEEAHVIENVAKKQTRIYNDSADYGYPYKMDNPTPDVTELIRVIGEFKALDKKYPKEKLFIRNRETWGKGSTAGVSLDIIIFWEMDEGYYCGTKYHISFNKTPKHSTLINRECDAFISVDIESYKERA